MAVVVLHEGPKNLTVLVNTGGGTLTVSALSPPCAGLVLTEVQADPVAAGTVAGPTKTVWNLAANANVPVCFERFGGIEDGLGNWVLTVSAGIAILSFEKVKPQHPFPN